MDLNEFPQTLWGRLTFWLHIIHCSACKNYLDLTHALGQAVREYAKSSHLSVDVLRLNQELIEKYSKK